MGGVDDVEGPEDGVVDEEAADVDGVGVADAEEAGAALGRAGAGGILPVGHNLTVSLCGQESQ